MPGTMEVGRLEVPVVMNMAPLQRQARGDLKNRMVAAGAAIRRLSAVPAAGAAWGPDRPRADCPHRQLGGYRAYRTVWREAQRP